MSEFRGIAYLESLPQWRKGAFSPLEIPEKILFALGNPQNKIKTIHVAGTNGKGTSCAAISTLLIAAGYKTGFFSSPHLIDVTERCRINNQALAPEKLDYYLTKVAEVVNWDSSAMTYFVATACAAFLCFAEEQVDYAVIEVGLGGKFDATNLISKPELAIITNIDLDHTDLLGSTLASIAENKAGIIKENSKVLLGNIAEQAKKVILDIASKQSAEVFYTETLMIDAENELMRSVIGQAAGSLALSALKILKIDASVESIKDLSWQGRLQFIETAEGKKFLIDGAHNSAGFRMLFMHIKDLAKRQNFKNITLILGLKKRSDWRESAIEIKKSIEDLQRNQLKVDLRLINWDQGVESLVNFFDIDDCMSDSLPNLILHAQSDLVVITGSLYLIGEAINGVRPN